MLTPMFWASEIHSRMGTWSFFSEESKAYERRQREVVRCSLQVRNIADCKPGSSFGLPASPCIANVTTQNKNEALPSIVSTYLSAKSEDAEDVDAADLGGLQADAELIKAAAASLYSGTYLLVAP